VGEAPKERKRAQVADIPGLQYIHGGVV